MRPPTDLKGGRVVEVFEIDGEVILVIEVGGRVLQAEVWRDPEGNGPGWLDVSVIPGATLGKQMRLAGPGDVTG